MTSRYWDRVNSFVSTIIKPSYVKVEHGKVIKVSKFACRHSRISSPNILTFLTIFNNCGF